MNEISFKIFSAIISGSHRQTGGSAVVLAPGVASPDAARPVFPHVTRQWKGVIFTSYALVKKLAGQTTTRR